MALTESTHRVASSVSGTKFKTYTDGTDSVQQVAPLASKWVNSATVAGSPTAVNGGDPCLLIRVIVGVASSGGSLELVDTTSVSIIDTGQVGVFEFGCWVTSLTFEQKTDAADVTLIYA